MICTDSIHSLHKVQRQYPHINQSLIQELYGLKVPALKRYMWDFRETLPQLYSLVRLQTEREYVHLNKLNLTEFYLNTTSQYFMFHCDMQDINCRSSWKTKRTTLGTCLTLNPNEIYRDALKAEQERKKRRENRRPAANQTFSEVANNTILDVLAKLDVLGPPKSIRELDFIIGYNKSDLTFGWNGFNNVMRLYYMDNDEDYVSKTHAISLVPGLNPTITFSRSETKLLGKPFTSCSHEANYTQRTCQARVASKNTFFFDKSL